MKIAFICDTPLQVFNSIILCWYHLKGNNCDLFIANDFAISEKLYNRISENNIFENVYLYDYSNYEEKITKKMLETVFPRKYLKLALHKKNITSLDKYKQIYISVPTSISILVSLLNPSAELFYFEDGMGNYSRGAPVLTHKWRKIICRILFRSFPNFVPTALYVNNIELCIKRDISDIRKITPVAMWEDDFKGKIRYIFDFKETNIYRKSKFIFLTHPDDVNKHANIILDSIINEQIYDFLREQIKNCIIRVHPRDKTRIPNEFTNIDNNGNLWEIICADFITDEHVLIGMCSTAQIISKLMYDKEPYIVYTYYLYKEILGEKIADLDKAAENLRRIYRTPSKIKIVHSFEEFYSVVLDMKNK